MPRVLVLRSHQIEPPANLLAAIKERGITLVRGATECLGSIIGTDQDRMSQWAFDQAASSGHAQLFETLLNPSIPVQSAMAILRMCAIPRMGYLARTLKPSLIAKAAAHFDSKVIDTAVTKLRLPHNLSSGARLSLTLHSVRWFWST